MEPDTYEQYQADKNAVGDTHQWLKAQDRCEVTLYNGTPLSVTPANFVELEIWPTPVWSSSPITRPLRRPWPD